MYEKVKNLRKFVCKGSSQRIIAVSCAVMFIINLALQDTEEFFSLFRYPEATYQNLEKEADILVRTNSFETNYELTITNYNFKEKTLSMQLSSSDAELDIIIENYGQQNQTYTRSRDINSAISQVLIATLSLLFVTLFMTALGVLAILLLASILQLIAFIIHKIIKFIKTK